MATIVQPYNDWRENLAINLITPLIGNMIQRTQEANQNRKMNALIDKTLSDLAANSQGGLMSSQALPEGYNDNGWAQAMHNSYTPLTQFDMGTSGITPMNLPAQSAVPSQQDFMKAMLANLGTKRFSMLNPEKVNQYLSPFYDVMKQARDDELKKQAIDNIRGVQDDKGRLFAMQEGAINGAVPDNVLNSAQDWAKWNGISPMQQAGLDFQQRQLDENARQYDASLAQRNKEHTDNIGLSYAQLKQIQDQFEANRKDSNFWRGIEQDNWDRTFNQNQFNLDRTFNAGREDAERNYELQGRQMSSIEQGQMNEKNKIITDQLTKDYEYWIEEANNATTDESRNYARQQAQNIQRQMLSIMGYTQPQENVPQQTTMPQGQKPSTNNKNNAVTRTLWGDMLKGGTVTSNYGMRNGNHHNGIDVAAVAGSEILMPDLGVPLTVKEISDRSPEKGYGNYVVLSGNVNGHNVELKIAHMQNHSINVGLGQQISAGTLIGKVGNTGRTGNSKRGYSNWYEGKDFGNHMHLEVKLDGKNIDPATFFGRMQYLKKNDEYADRAFDAMSWSPATQSLQKEEQNPNAQTYPEYISMDKYEELCQKYGRENVDAWADERGILIGPM